MFPGHTAGPGSPYRAWVLPRVKTPAENPGRPGGAGSAGQPSGEKEGLRGERALGNAEGLPGEQLSTH